MERSRRGRLSGWLDSLDPALAYSALTWNILSLTNDGLVGFHRVGGLEGTTLVPDLARSLPDPTDGGPTYTFQLRQGLRYSTGEPVRPEDFRRAIERVFANLDSGGYPIRRRPLLLGDRRCSEVRLAARSNRAICPGDHRRRRSRHGDLPSERT